MNGPPSPGHVFTTEGTTGRAILLDHLLARGGGDGLRDEVASRASFGSILSFSRKFVGSRFDDLLDALRDVVEPRHAQREAHPLHRAEEVIASGTDDPGRSRRGSPALRPSRPIGDLRRLELRGDLDDMRLSSPRASRAAR